MFSPYKLCSCQDIIKMSDGYSSRFRKFHLFAILAVVFTTVYVGYRHGPLIVSIGKERFSSRDESSAIIGGHEFLPINFTLPDDALTDPKTTAFANNSRMYLVDKRRLFEVGQTIESVGYIMGKFKAGDVEEITRCHPLARVLKGRELCNLTLENGGMSWYCWKPSNIKLLCHDWVEVTYRPPSQGLPLTDAEKGLLSPGGYGISISGNIEVEVRSSSIIYMNVPECANVNSAITWNQHSPIGYYYNNVWKPLHCKGFTNLAKIQKCLKGKKLVIFGDSTTRQWFQKLEQLLDCKLVSESWSTTKWHKPAKALCEHFDFSMEWFPNAMPFNVGTRWESRRYLRPVSAYLEEIGPNENIIIVVHMYMHFIAYHPDVFWDRIQKIASSVTHLLQRNPHVKIFMKGTHTFLSLNGDYFNSVFDNMSHQAFKGLHDKVVFLKIRDFTDAKKTFDIHPPFEDVEEMVKYMFSYLC